MPALRHTLDRFARNYLVALRCETRIRPGAEAEAAPVAEGLPHLPGAGWLVGIAGCLSFAIAAILLRGNPYGPLVAALVASVTTALLTAARNEVAFQLWLEPAGTVGLVLLLLARVALLASVAAVSEPAVIAVLFAAPVISRFVPLAIAHWHEGPSAPPGALRVPALWCVLPLLLLVPAGGLRVLLLALVGAALATLVLYRAASGRNASGLHASLQQVCEAGFYLGAAIAA